MAMAMSPMHRRLLHESSSFKRVVYACLHQLLVFPLTDIGDASSLLSASSSASSGLDKLGRDRGESLSSAISRDRVRGESLDQASGVGMWTRLEMIEE